MAEYVDGFVIVVPKKNLAVYKKQAQLACKVWMEYGALDYRETTGDDMKQAFGKDFPKLTGAKAGDVVVFAWIAYKSKAARDRINKKVMADPRLSQDKMEMTFDLKKMSYGGFETLVKSRGSK